MMTEFSDKSKECREMTDSTSNQCKCWSDLSVLMANIKAFDCKRIKTTQKLLTGHKNDCIKVFSKCKKSEDHSVEAVYSCMEDHSMGFINQSLDSLGKMKSSIILFKLIFSTLAEAAVVETSFAGSVGEHSSS